MNLTAEGGGTNNVGDNSQSNIAVVGGGMNMIIKNTVNNER
jgi:hypothetical protein